MKKFRTNYRCSVFWFLTTLICQSCAEPHENNILMNYTPSPIVLISDTLINLGGINGSRTIEFSFSVKNIGDKILQVDKIKAGCSCTTIDFIPSKISPNDSLLVNLTLKPDTLVHGNHSETIALSTNAPKRFHFLHYKWKILKKSQL